MTYDEAKRVAVGDMIRTTYGERGPVEEVVDTGHSRLFYFVDERSGQVEIAHSSKASKQD